MDKVELVSMTEVQFQAWLPGAIAGYGLENVASGRWSKEESLERSREEHDKLLPHGLATPDHRLWSITRSGDHEPVGVLWINIVKTPRPSAFIYNIEIDPEFQRRGYARQAMTLLEEEARRLGLESIRLHVFAHNSAARPLYESLGYVPTNLMMSKSLL